MVDKIVTSTTGALIGLASTVGISALIIFLLGLTTSAGAFRRPAGLNSTWNIGGLSRSRDYHASRKDYNGSWRFPSSAAPRRRPVKERLARLEQPLRLGRHAGGHAHTAGYTAADWMAAASRSRCSVEKAGDGLSPPAAPSAVGASAAAAHARAASG